MMKVVLLLCRERSALGAYAEAPPCRRAPIPPGLIGGVSDKLNFQCRLTTCIMRLTLLSLHCSRRAPPTPQGLIGGISDKLNGVMAELKDIEAEQAELTAAKDEAAAALDAARRCAGSLCVSGFKLVCWFEWRRGWQRYCSAVCRILGASGGAGRCAQVGRGAGVTGVVTLLLCIERRDGAGLVALLLCVSTVISVSWRRCIALNGPGNDSFCFHRHVSSTAFMHADCWLLFQEDTW